MINISDQLKIIVIFHKKYPTCPLMMQQPNVYVPVLAGKDDISKNVKLFIKNMHCDNESGDNISWMNPYFNEVTAMYWAWKNPSVLNNPKFIGVHHYRRFFDPKDLLEVFNGKIVVNKEKEYVDEISVLDYFFGMNICENMEKISEIYFKPNDKIKKYFEEFMQLDYQYNREMFVCPWFIFDALMQYLIKMFPYLSKHVFYSFNHPKFYRNVSYMIECIIGFFFYCLSKSESIKIHEAGYNYFSPEGYE